ncbi:hypothetical protein J437_LFUL004380 [Ladona fulva]|uniref:Uncharacterized protein n=1 Tax=Ladona fulva TaxID=123851 RepID=A0A8K0NW53_LADFU|nr:hypothetical protein J437_LFUL004380 [Ladona fulva]
MFSGKEPVETNNSRCRLVTENSVNIDFTKKEVRLTFKNKDQVPNLIPVNSTTFTSEREEENSFPSEEVLHVVAESPQLSPEQKERLFQILKSNRRVFSNEP